LFVLFLDKRNRKEIYGVVRLWLQYWKSSGNTIDNNYKLIWANILY